MQVNVQRLSPVLVEFNVEIDAERVKSELDKAYVAVGRNARIRGFRPGRAPRQVLVHLYGPQVAQDVAKRLVDETFPSAVSEQKLQPVTQPAVESAKLEADKPFAYKARVEVLPEIASVTFEALEAKRPKVEITPEQVDEQLQSLRRSQSTLEPLKEARPAAKGDVVSLDFTVEVLGAVVDDAGATGFDAELGAGTLIKEIDEALQGKQANDQVAVDVAIPEGAAHPKLRGQTATFKIHLKDVKERVLPEADDEFAKDLGEFETLDALKADISARLERQAKERAENTVAEQLVLELVKANPITVPPSLVEKQMQLSEQEIVARARSQGQKVNNVGDELRASLLQDSEIKVRAGLLMAEIAKKEGIQVSNEDIEEGLKELAEQSGKNVAKLRVEYRDARKREMLIGMILENKVLDIIESKAKITDEA